MIQFDGKHILGSKVADLAGVQSFGDGLCGVWY